MATTSVRVPGARLEVTDRGTGDPVLFIPTALTADELDPLATDVALAANRRITYRRRGYAGSSPVSGPGSIARDAADAAGLLRGLAVDRAHVVGLSFSAAIALQLAVDEPALVHTLTLIEPPPVHTSSASDFRAANEELLRIRREQGPLVALDRFLTMVVAPDWPRLSDERLPGSSAQMRRDATTFFDTDIPALLAWEHHAPDVSGIACPILSVGGTESGPWFAEVHQLMRVWFPHADDVVVDGADHSLAVTHAPDIARALAAFLADHEL